MSRSAKLILGLTVLLACPDLGLDSRAQASFALAQGTRETDRPTCSLGFEFRLVLNGEGAEAPASLSSGAVRDEAPSLPEPEAPRKPELPGKPAPAHGDFQTNGASSGAGPSIGAGWGAGLSLLPPLRAQLLGAEVTERLFLANERLKPPPFASRLFRPPRAV